MPTSGAKGSSWSSGQGQPSKPPKYEDRQEVRGKRQLSCAECHRLKLKCDREVPCSNCIRRGCIEICPNGIRIKKRSSDNTGEIVELKDRIASLESLLTKFVSDPSPKSPNNHSDPNGAPTGGVTISTTQSFHDNGIRQTGGEGNGGGRGEISFWRTKSTRSQSPPSNRMRKYNEQPERMERSMGMRSGINMEMSNQPMNHLQTPPMVTTGGASVIASIGPASRPYSGTLPQSDVRGDEGNIGTIPAGAANSSYGTIEQGYGTLMIGRAGRSKWLGPTAGTEWLKDQEVSRGPSPSHSPVPKISALQESNITSSLPFGQPRRLYLSEFLQQLPPFDEASVLVDSYYRYYSWNHDVAPRRAFQIIFNQVYKTSLSPRTDDDFSYLQELSLVFSILAMGAIHNLDFPPNDPSANHFHSLAEESLIAGNFLAHNTIPGVQSLVIMAHYHLETDKGRTGDAAWPLWGLAMRIIVAMGLHRDGKRWNLPDDVIEERRQVFWECHTIDVFQANCFSRPSALRPEHIDTAFPSQTWADGPTGVKSFRTLKYELCQISNAVLNQAMDVRPSGYAAVNELYEKLRLFEKQIPYDLRCRGALVVLPSTYPDPESAIANSPEVNRRNLHRTFQQFQLALNVSETILFLQRPYFARAMQEHPADPTRSIYGTSYLAVVERCNVMIQVVSGLYELYPAVTARHWFFWYHLFTAAVCVGTLIIKNPHNVLVSFALGQVDQAISLYSSVLENHTSTSAAAAQNLQWLLQLRKRALGKAAQMSGMSGLQETSREGIGDGEGEEDVELLGWRTRLIERAAKGVQKATTIANQNKFRDDSSLSSEGGRGSGRGTGTGNAHPVGGGLGDGDFSGGVSMRDAIVDPTSIGRVGSRGGDGMGVGGLGGIGSDTLIGMNQLTGFMPGEITDNSTDELLHQFWDPALIGQLSGDTSDAATATNWWNWTTPGVGGGGGPGEVWDPVGR